MGYARTAATLTSSVTAAMFTFLPSSIFDDRQWITRECLNQLPWLEQLGIQMVNSILSRGLGAVCIAAIVVLLYTLFLAMRRKVIVKGQNYLIRVEYGDIFKIKKCKRIINFDECFTTHVGDGIADINQKSICGQYLHLNPDLNVEQLIKAAQINPAPGRSEYRQLVRYEPGTIVPNGNDLLMAFAKLDARGKGRLTRDEYLDCLDLLWRELENYYAEEDVCVPILGAGTTAFEDGSGASIPQQDLLDIMILSYKLSSRKIKLPYKLRIICRKNDNFSINRINL